MYPEMKRVDDWTDRRFQSNPSQHEAARLWTAARIAAFRSRRFESDPDGSSWLATTSSRAPRSRKAVMLTAVQSLRLFAVRMAGI
jgi:hypothetical protein